MSGFDNTETFFCIQTSTPTLPAGKVISRIQWNNMSEIGNHNYENADHLINTGTMNTVSYIYKKTDVEDELSLLEELGIDKKLIIKRMISSLNPFTHGVLVGNYDLAGPIAICIIFTMLGLISGSNVSFGHIYLLSIISCLLMYILLLLMTPNTDVTLVSVCSVLGYGLLPLVFLTLINIVIPLHFTLGVIICILVVLWCSLTTSHIFVNIFGNVEQKLLIAYPCFLCYSIFAFMLIF